MNDEQYRVVRFQALPAGPSLFFHPTALSDAYVTVLHIAYSALSDKKTVISRASSFRVNGPWLLRENAELRRWRNGKPIV